MSSKKPTRRERDRANQQRAAQRAEQGELSRKAARRQENSKPWYQRNRDLLYFLVGAAVFAVVGAWALLNSSQSDPLPVEPAVAITDDEAELLPVLADPTADDAVGMKLPQIAATTMDGSTVTIDPDDGRPKAILVMAHWCAFCQEEVRELGPWLNDGGYTGNGDGNPFGVDLYTISTMHEPTRGNWPPQRWFDRADWPTPVLVDDTDDNNPIARGLGISGTPFLVLVDADGHVVFRTSGLLGPDAYADMFEQLSQLSGDDFDVDVEDRGSSDVTGTD